MNFEQTFKNIDDMLYKDSRVDSEIDYIGLISWVMFLHYLDELERDKADEADLQKATGTYHAWRNINETVIVSASSTEALAKQSHEYNDEPGFCYSATIDEVAKQDYRLTPFIYVGTEAIEDDGIPFEDKMETLKAQLQEQFAKGNKLQQQILENFEKF